MKNLLSLVTLALALASPLAGQGERNSELVGGDLGHRLAQSMLTRGDLMRRLERDPEGAANIYSQLLSGDRYDAETRARAQLGLGRCYADLGRADEAHRCFEAAAGLEGPAAQEAREILDGRPDDLDPRLLAKIRSDIDMLARSGSPFVTPAHQSLVLVGEPAIDVLAFEARSRSDNALMVRHLAVAIALIGGERAARFFDETAASGDVVLRRSLAVGIFSGEAPGMLRDALLRQPVKGALERWLEDGDPYVRMRALEYHVAEKGARIGAMRLARVLARLEPTLRAQALDRLLEPDQKSWVVERLPREDAGDVAPFVALLRTSLEDPEPALRSAVGRLLGSRTAAEIPALRGLLFSTLLADVRGERSGPGLAVEDLPTWFGPRPEGLLDQVASCARALGEAKVGIQAQSLAQAQTQGVGRRVSGNLTVRREYQDPLHRWLAEIADGLLRLDVVDASRAEEVLELLRSGWISERSVSFGAWCSARGDGVPIAKVAEGLRWTIRPDEVVEHLRTRPIDVEGGRSIAEAVLAPAVTPFGPEWSRLEASAYHLLQMIQSSGARQEAAEVALALGRDPQLHEVVCSAFAPEGEAMGRAAARLLALGGDDEDARRLRSVLFVKALGAAPPSESDAFIEAYRRGMTSTGNIHRKDDEAGPILRGLANAGVAWRLERMRRDTLVAVIRAGLEAGLPQVWEDLAASQENMNSRFSPPFNVTAPLPSEIVPEIAARLKSSLDAEGRLPGVPETAVAEVLRSLLWHPIHEGARDSALRRDVLELAFRIGRHQLSSLALGVLAQDGLPVAPWRGEIEGALRDQSCERALASLIAVWPAADLEFLGRCAEEALPAVRKAALARLAELDPKAAAAAIRERLAKDGSVAVKVEAAGLALRVADDELVERLIESLKDPAEAVREAARAALESIRFHREQKRSWTRWSREVDLDAASAADALVTQATRGATKKVRLAAIASLGTLAKPETLPVLVRLTTDADAEVAAAAERALRRINGED